MSATALLDTLAGLGVRTTVTSTGNLRLEPASCIPADLLAEVKAHKPDLLEALSGRASIRRAAPNWAAISARPGHCGSCTRWQPAPEWGSLMGVCGAPAAAFWPEPPALAIHIGHSCTAYGGKGYQRVPIKAHESSAETTPST